MRRVIAVLVMCAAFGGACGSGSNDASSTGTTAAGGGSATTAKGGSGSFADACLGRNVAAPPAQGQSLDYAQAAKDLQFALDHAPAEIKPDFTILATPLLTYFQVLASNNGNFAAAVQNAQFQAAAQRFTAADYKAAADRVRAWFTEHCK